MFGLFRKKAEAPGPGPGGPSSAPLDWRDQNPVAAAGIMEKGDDPVGVAAATGEPEAPRELEAFAARFCHRPGVRLMDFIAEQEIDPLLDWFRPDNPEPEPKAFVRLGLKMLDAGLEPWEQSGFTIYLKGRWSSGGTPTRASQEAISILAQVLGKPITVMFTRSPDSDAPIHVLRFQP